MLSIAISDDMPEFSSQLHALIRRWETQPEDLSVDIFSDADSMINAHSEKT